MLTFTRATSRFPHLQERVQELVQVNKIFPKFEQVKSTLVYKLETNSSKVGILVFKESLLT